jgi:3-oxoacyl-[acyl-carrier protein] reductase
MSGDFTGRVALVTGAARGLGRATAARLLARGARVAVNVRGEERAAAIARELGPEVLAAPGDLADPAAIAEVVGRTLERFGRLDVLVNNAALALSTRFEKISEEEWRRAMDVNVTAPFLLLRAALPAMKAERYGRVVNLSSTAGKSVSTLGGAHYTTSKAALLGLTRAAAKELGPYGITVNAVCPGLIDTELTRENATPEALAAYARSFPIPRLGEPVEVADLICFLTSEQAGYITGAAVDINGGDLMV